VEQNQKIKIICGDCGFEGTAYPVVIPGIVSTVACPQCGCHNVRTITLSQVR